MNPMKVLCAYGEAGMLVTDEKYLYEKIESLRYNGTFDREECHYQSLNCRLDTVQAAMLMGNLKRLPERINRRREIADFYSRELGLIVRCPAEKNEYFNIYYTYTILTEQRDQLRDFLQAREIETKVHHPILMPDQKAYSYLPGYDIPVAKKLVQQILSIPNHQDMTPDMVEYVVDSIKSFFGAT